MRKVFKRIPFYKVFVLLFVSLYTLLPSVQAVGVVVEDYASEDVTVETEVAVEQEGLEVDDSEDILDEGISDPQWIANPELEEDSEEEADEPLFVYEDGVYTVFSVVEGEEYVYPGNEDLRIKFTSISEDGDLVISRVTLTEQQKEELNTTDDYGWSITSSMSNGSFTYDLTLPNTLGNEVEVKYTEDNVEFNSIDNVVVNENVIHVYGLDHFTVFVVVSPTDDHTDPEDCNKVYTAPDQCFETIQEAINSSSGGETIYVGEGVYEEPNGLYIPNSVTIVGAGQNETIVRISRPSGGYGIHTSSDSGLELVMRDISFEAISGISNFFFHIAHNHFFALENSNVTGMGRDYYIPGGSEWGDTVGGVDIINVNNAVLRNVTVRETSRNAVSFSAVKNIDVENITIEDNGAREGSAGIAIYKRSDYSHNNPENISINGGLITGSPLGINLGDKTLNVVDNNDIQGLSFVDNQVQAVASPNEIEALLANNTFDKAVVVRENPIIVPSIFSSIQDAITWAPVDSIIQVFEGTYIEDGQIIINKNLSIVGEDKDTTIILPNNDTGGSGNTRGWFLVDDYDVEFNLSNVTLDGGGKNIYQAIRSYGTGTIDNNIIRNIRYSTNMGFGIAVFGNMTISDNLIYNIDRVGISIFDMSLFTGGTAKANNVIVTGNTLTGKGPEADVLGYGIELDSGARATISNNTFRNWGPDSTAWASAGIFVHDAFSESHGIAAHATITGNTIEDNEYGIYVGYYDIIPSVVTVNNNNIQGNIERGVFSAIPIDATLNWWGHITGPSGNGPGLGDSVSSNVTYKEWLCEPYKTDWTSEDGVCSLEAPTTLGFNVSSLAENPGDTPVALSCGSYTNDNTPSHVWTPVALEGVRYQRQAKAPGGNWWTDPTTYTDTHNQFGYFGQGWEGEWEVRVRAFYDTNENGEYNEGEPVSDWSNVCSITYDATKPTVELTSIESGGLYKGTIDFRGTSVEENPESYRFYLRYLPEEGGKLGVYNSGWVPLDRDLTDETLYNWDSTTSPYGDGTYRVRFDVRDKAGNWKHDLKDIYIDNTRPQGSIDYIYYESKDVKDTSFITNDNTPTIGGNSNDNFGVKSIDVKIGSYTSTHGAGGPGFWEVGFGNPIPDGTYPITLTLTDIAGNETVVTKDITIDTLAPTASHTYYKNEGEITGPTAYVQGVNQLSFKAQYFDETPSSGILKDSYVIFDSNEEGTARTGTAYCGWRNVNNTLMITNNPLEDFVPFTNCEPTLSDGQYFMYHQVYDNATRKDIPSITQFRDVKGLHFVVDTQDPQGSVDHIYYEPSDTQSTHFITNDNTPVLGGTCSDNIGLDTVLLEINGQTYPIACDEDTWRSDALDTLLDGIYTATLTLTDLAGNETVKTQNIQIDTVTPTAEHTYYRNGTEITDSIAYVQGVDELTFTAEYWDDDPSSGLYKDVFVIFRDSDLKAYCGWRQFLTGGVLLNGSNYQNLETPQSLSDCIASLDDGAYHIRHRIYDNATRSTAPLFNQHRQYVTLSFIVDTTEPQTILDDISDTHHNSRPLDISGTSTDDNGIAEVRIYGSNTGEDRWTYLDTVTPDISGNWTYPATPPDEGVYDVKIEVVDLAGNIEELFMTNITVDGTDPISTINSPSDGHITNETPVIEGETTDDFSVDYVVLSYTTYNPDTDTCGDTWTELATLNNPNNESPFEWIYDEDDWGLEDGIYCIKAQGTDLAGNTEETSILKNIIYDTTSPQVLLNLIAGILNVTAEDLLSGEKTIEVRIGENGEWLPYTEDMNLNDLVNNEPGTYTIYVRVTDKAGNTTTESTTFTIPSPPPTTAEEVLGAIIAPFTPQPAQALGTGGYLLAQTTTEEETEEEIDDTEVEDTEDVEEEDTDEEVMGTEDENGEEETEGRPWWIYPLIILPLLLLFFILWKRRKEDEEQPQY